MKKQNRLPFSSELLGFLELIKTASRRFGIYLSLLQNNEIKLNVKDNAFYTFDGKDIIQVIDGKANVVKFGKLFYSLIDQQDLELYSWHASRIKNFDTMIEEATNAFKSFLAKESIHIIERNDISQAYQVGNFLISGTLGKSCMNTRDLSIFKIYEDNAKMLVTYSPSGQISSRALIWDDVQVIGSDKRIKFMDRIYTSSDYQNKIYFDYAKENGYFVKHQQNHLALKKFISPSGEMVEMDIFINIDLTKYSQFPYLDTFRYSNLTDTISNVKSNTIVEELEDNNVILYQFNTSSGKPMKIKTKVASSIDTYENMDTLSNIRVAFADFMDIYTRPSTSSLD